MNEKASSRSYVPVYIALLFLTGLTTGVAYIDLGMMNIPVALLIAAAKSTLVMVFFMRIVRTDRAAAPGLLASVFLLLVLIAICCADAVINIRHV